MDTAVGLVQAYLHLNGYLVLTEVPVQLEANGAFYTETDLDILAVRFPHEPEAHPSRSSTWEEFYRGVDPTLDPDMNSIDFIVGEVKEGRSHANPALRRQATLHFALHRIGCCPEGDVMKVAAEVARKGEARLQVRGGSPTRVRLVVFGGRGDLHDEGLTEIPLRHVALYVQERLQQYRAVLQGIEFKDETLSLFRLIDKVGLELAINEHQPATPLPETAARRPTLPRAPGSEQRAATGRNPAPRTATTSPPRRPRKQPWYRRPFRRSR
jgi:hypothetical protein